MHYFSKFRNVGLVLVLVFLRVFFSVSNLKGDMIILLP